MQCVVQDVHKFVLRYVLGNVSDVKLALCVFLGHYVLSHREVLLVLVDDLGRGERLSRGLLRHSGCLLREVTREIVLASPRRSVPLASVIFRWCALA